MSKAMRLRAFLNKRNTIFHPVVRFDPAVQKLISIDLTSTNNSLTEEIYSDIERFNKFIAEHISIHNATYAIGGYDELRVVYNRSQNYCRSVVAIIVIKPRTMYNAGVRTKNRCS